MGSMGSPGDLLLFVMNLCRYHGLLIMKVKINVKECRELSSEDVIICVAPGKVFGLRNEGTT